METIDLKPFCDKQDFRYAFSNPFVKDGFRYATDSRICVRIPSSEPNTIPPEKKKDCPGVNVVFDNFPSEGFRNIDELIAGREASGPYDMRDCDCGELNECHKCLGSGTQCCPHCDQDMDCEDCDGTGEALQAAYNCQKCNGSGEVPNMLCKVGDRWYAEHYLNLIRTLPDVQCAAMDGEKMLAFRFADSGQGVLCEVQH
jgi:hypothetical protein